MAQLLDDLGAHVLVSDLRSAYQLASAVEQLDGRCIEFVLGEHPPEILNRADLVVVSPGVPWNVPILKTARERGIPVVGELEVAAQVCQAPIIAITGTKGKSTTTALIGKALESSGHFGKVLVGGNIGLAFSRDVRELGPGDIAVIETSSFQLEGIRQFRPSVSIMTNLHPDHLDRHRTMDAYIAAKQRIFLNQTDEDLAILNVDDPRVAVLQEHVRAKLAWFSTSPAEDLGGRYPDALVGYVEAGNLVLEEQGIRQQVGCVNALQLLGQHNVANVLAACLAAHSCHVPIGQIWDAVSTFRAPAHTLELVREAQGVRFVNDSKATNIAATQAALEAFDRPIRLIIGGYDKGNDYTPLVPLVRQRVSQLILLGTDTEKIRQALASEAETVQVTDMDMALAVATTDLVPGTTVLLSPACASFDLFEDYRQRGEVFCRTVMSLDLPT